MHDARGIAEGASGRNGGFALGGGAARYDVARETYGADAGGRLLALDGTGARPDGRARAATLCSGPAATAWPATRRSATASALEYEALREDGFEAEWLDDVPSAAAGRFHGALSHPRRRLDPAGALRPAPRGAAAAAGAEFREHDQVADVEALDADRVVVATDGYGHGLVPELADLIWPTRGQVIASEPLDDVLYDRPHYARQGFDYWQQLPDGRILLGGFRDVSILDELTDVEETTPAIQASLESFLYELAGGEVEVTHRWAGIFGLTQDMLPLVGAVPGRDERIWVAGGYSGPRQRPRLRLRRARRRRDPRHASRRSWSCSIRRASSTS